MKKLSILLSLVMVLGMAVSAAAAEVTVSGEIKMVTENYTDTTYKSEKDGGGVDVAGHEAEFLDTFAVKDAKVNFAAKINDNLKATVQTNNGTVGNKWFEYKVSDFTAKAGQFRVSRGGNVDSLAANYLGVGATYAFDGGNVTAVLNPDKVKDSNTFVFNGKYAPIAGLTVYGDFVKPTKKDAKSKYAVELDYEIAGITVFGEYGKNVVKNPMKAYASEEKDIQVVGATTTISVVDLTADYDLVDKEINLNAETTYDGIIFGADVNNNEERTQLSGYVKVKF